MEFLEEVNFNLILYLILLLINYYNILLFDFLHV